MVIKAGIILSQWYLLCLSPPTTLCIYGIFLLLDFEILFLPQVKESTHRECESEHTHMNLPFSVVDANFKQESWNRGDDVSSYKRRKMAAS